MKPIHIHKCDVLVIGASLEGCVAAAVAGKRNKKVLLAENSGSLGQASTNGLYVHLPEDETAEKDVLDYMELILAGAGEERNTSKPIYHDQRLKTVLRHQLDAAGVQVLTHVFLAEPVMEGDKLAGYRFGTKTGYIEVRADRIIDATDRMDAAGAAGLTPQVRNRRVSINAKFNQISTEAIRSNTAEILQEGEGYLIGKLDYRYNCSLSGLNMSVDNPFFCHDTDYKELIIYGLTASLGQPDSIALSQAQTGLRRFAYALREDIRQGLKGFEKAHIIHVAPRLDCYGLRSYKENPYDNLTLLNNEVTAYNNRKAIELGIRAGSLD